jgi:hypothetical protein
MKFAKDTEKKGAVLRMAPFFFGLLSINEEVGKGIRQKSH